MPNLQRAQASLPTATLFGGTPSQTQSPSQGSINLYRDGSCSASLSDAATPLLAGECLNMPISGIKAASIASLPICDDYGTPLLIVSDRVDCRNSTVGASADSGAVGVCQAFSSGTDIGSVEFTCYGNGISSVAGPARTNLPTSSAMIETVYYPQGNSNTDSGSRNKCECCCVCTVM